MLADASLPAPAPVLPAATPVVAAAPAPAAADPVVMAEAADPLAQIRRQAEMAAATA